MMTRSIWPKLSAALLLWTAIACSPTTPSDEAPAPSTPAASEAPATTTPKPQDSIYVVDGTWTNQQGHAFEIASLLCAHRNLDPPARPRCRQRTPPRCANRHRYDLHPLRTRMPHHGRQYERSAHHAARQPARPRPMAAHHLRYRTRHARSSRTLRSKPTIERSMDPPARLRSPSTHDLNTTPHSIHFAKKHAIKPLQYSHRPRQKRRHHPAIRRLRSPNRQSGPSHPARRYPSVTSLL